MRALICEYKIVYIVIAQHHLTCFGLQYFYINYYNIILFLQPAVTGNWVFELNIQNYTNERHASYLSTLNQYACCDCPAGVACSASTLSALGHICTDRDCYNRFLICVDGKCIYSESTNAGDDLTFTNKIVNLDNPLKFEGNSQVCQLIM